MSISPRRFYYLQAMGIDVWTRRRKVPRPEVSKKQTIATVSAEPELAAADIEAIAPELETGPSLSSLSSQEQRALRIGQMDWETLRQEVLACSACKLFESRTQGVFGVGDQDADWMIIGEAPGADEDRLGEPFVGRAGKLLDLMLQAIGLRRDQVFIANILKSRPPKNRDPAADEVLACWPFLMRQLDLVKPKIILAMGRIAAQNLLATQSPVGRLRGRVHRFGSSATPLIVTYHPAYLLRSPREKRKSWDDLQLAQRTAMDNLC